MAMAAAVRVGATFPISGGRHFRFNSIKIILKQYTYHVPRFSVHRSGNCAGAPWNPGRLRAGPAPLAPVPLAPGPNLSPRRWSTGPCPATRSDSRRILQILLSWTVPRDKASYYNYVCYRNVSRISQTGFLKRLT
jgi:hypothetical protein